MSRPIPFGPLPIFQRSEPCGCGEPACRGTLVLRGPRTGHVLLCLCAGCLTATVEVEP